MLKYLGFLGGKRQIKSLGGFMIVVFGFAGLFLELSAQVIEPSWVVWFFRGGVVLGLILLIGGALASDIPNRFSNHFKK